MNVLKFKSFVAGNDVYTVAGTARWRPLPESWPALFNCEKLNGHRPTMHDEEDKDETTNARQRKLLVLVNLQSNWCNPLRLSLLPCALVHSLQFYFCRKSRGVMSEIVRGLRS